MKLPMPEEVREMFTVANANMEALTERLDRIITILEEVRDGLQPAESRKE